MFDDVHIQFAGFKMVAVCRNREKIGASHALIFFISYYLVHCNLYLFLNEVASNAFKGALF